MEVKKIVDTFKVLSDITRLKIVKMLKEKTMCACELLEKLSITQPTLSHHMKRLQHSDIVSAEKKGIWMHYTLNNDIMKELIDFLTKMEVANNE